MEMSVTEVIFSFLGGLGISFTAKNSWETGFKHQQETGYEIF